MGKIEKSLILDSYIRRRKTNQNTEVCEKKKKREALRRLSIILRKCETLRTPDETKLLESGADIVKQILLRQDRVQQSKDRTLEKEDPYETIDKKAQQLADVISRARHLVCYTGAGISTSARIPDYRGSQGIWTLLQKGKDIGEHDLSQAEPTYTHMALYELHRRNILRYVLSQNCDGLHLRSGLPRRTLSEVHGNMYIEVCKQCKPNVEYWRLFDTTEQTARYYHKTNRRCHMCGKPLVDTIVHFGERGSLKWPLNWDGACSHAEKADVILCLGSSLKVLKKYSWLWAMDRSKNKRPKIYIVNLQWTPKDAVADLKINGKCDDVMRLVMKYLNIVVPKYSRLKDPIFSHASLLLPEEIHTVTQPMLKTSNDANNTGEFRQFIKSEIGAKKTERELPELIPINKIAGESISPNNRFIDDFFKTDNSCDRNNMHPNPAQIISRGSPRKIATLLPRRNNTDAVNNKTDSIQEDETCKFTAPTSRLPILETNTSQETAISDTFNLLTTLSEPPANEINRNSVPLNPSLSSSSSSSIIPPLLPMSQTTPSPSPFTPFPSQPATDRDCSNVDVGKENVKENHLSNSTESGNNPEQQLHLQLLCDNRNVKNDSVEEPPKILSPTNPNRKTMVVARGFSNSPPKFRNDLNSIKGKSTTEHDKSKNDEDFFFRDNDNYKSLLNYCKAAIQKSLPHWYDVNYAYSGLHSIIHPPPNEVDIWGTIIIPIFQLNRTDAECEFCFENYAEYNCQFYRCRQPNFLVKKQRNGRVILCECCDWSDELDKDQQLLLAARDVRDSIGDGDGEKEADSADANMQQQSNGDDGGRQCAKLDIVLTRDRTKVQPGWYGKGYRKLMRRKRKTKLSPLVTI